jgi:hypothetical protein
VDNRSIRRQILREMLGRIQKKPSGPVTAQGLAKQTA